ncbi:MAG: RICIN domain-containing protein [Bacteroidales bacterium]|nr:RICIN domain-containing protein [Bacteroidales bacterium]
MKFKLILFLLINILFFTNIASAQLDVLHGKTFYIQASDAHKKGINKGYWDIRGKNPAYSKGQSIIVWAKDNGDDRKFKFLKDPKNPGYYIITPLHGQKQNARVDVAGGKKANGADIILWDMNGGDNQKFKLVFTQNGYARIFNKNSMVLCLKGKSYENGSNVHIWQNHQGHQTEWALIDSETGKLFSPESNSTTTETVKKDSDVYTLLADEEFVFGKIGLNKQGNYKYTLVIVRKPNTNKEIYNFYGNYYAERPLGANLRKSKDPANYDKYDYFLIFNGIKFGPYDHIFSPGKWSNSNIDTWVSDDGKHISFVGTVAEKWYPVIYNNKASFFWTPGQAPDYDGVADKWVYSMFWSNEVYKLFEQGKPTIQSSKYIDQPIYSANGQLLYVSSPNSAIDKYIYLNYKQIDGPFKQVDFNGVGFIPGTEKVYYNTFTKIKLGSKEYVCKPDETVNSLVFNEDIVSFIVINKKSRKSIVFEYDIKTEQMISHGPYTDYTNMFSTGKYTYLVKRDKDSKQFSVIGQGGKVLWEKPHSLKSGENTGARISSSGDLYVWYKSQGVWKIDRNGENIPFNGYIAGIEPITFNPISGIPIIHSKIDKTIAGQIHHIYYGDLDFEVSGDLNAGKLYPTLDGKSIFYTVRTIEDEKWTYQLHKNGAIINNNAYGVIDEFAVTPTGDNYAMLVSNIEKAYSYIIMNNEMDKAWKLIINGKELVGNYGAPVYLKSKDKLVAIKQMGNSLVLVDLNSGITIKP